MKKLLFVAAVMTAVIQPAMAQTSPAPDPTREHRIWVAEQVISRVNDKYTKSLAQCRHASVFAPKAGEACENAIEKAYPTIVTAIRDTARTGDDAQWHKIVMIVRTFERQTDELISKSE